MRRSHLFLTLWAWPMAMGVLTTTGLCTALVSDTWGDWWSWVGLGVPVAVMAWFSWLRPVRAAGAPALDADSRPPTQRADLPSDPAPRPTP